MSVRSQRVRTLGFTVTRVGPIRKAFIEARPGVSVLYGVNGAGKSSLLEALKRGIAGQAGGVQVHVVVDDPLERGDLGAMEDDLIRALLRAGCSFIDSKLVEDYSGPWDYEELGLSEAAASDFRTPGEFLLEDNNLGQAVRAWMMRSHYPRNESTEMADQIASQGLFTLKPIGEHNAGRWIISISAARDELSPNVTSHLDRAGRLALKVLRAHYGTDRAPAPLDFDLSLMSPTEVFEDAFLQASRPGWAPYSFEHFGVLEPEPGLWPPVLLEEGSDVASLTLAHLTGGNDVPEGLIALLEGETLVLHDHVQGRLASLIIRANAIFEMLIPEPPVLTLEVIHPNRWMSGQSPVAWGAVDGPTLEQVAWDQLSDFQLRWATFAVGLATQALPSQESTRPVFAFIDEPERAAHPVAISHLARGLRQLGMEYGAHLFLASHSPDFLADPSAGLLHVHRDASGFAAVNSLEGPLMESLQLACDKLSIVPAQLLQLVRVFLIVEGEHDIAVLDEAIGDELRAARVHMLALRGTHNLLGFLEAQFLTAFSDAVFVMALDRTEAVRVQKAWEALKAATAMSLGDPGRPGRLNTAMAPLRSRTSSPEERQLAELLEGVARSGISNRFFVEGLTKPDIIEYLPVGRFIDGETSWKEAKVKWDRSTNFKAWLRSEGATVTTAFVRKVASDLERLHPDMSRLLETCRTAGSRSRNR